MRHLTLSIIMAVCINLGTGNPTFAVPQHQLPGSGAQSTEEHRAMGAQRIIQAERGRIMAVLGERIADQAILARAKEKLRSLPGEEIRLLSSLCDRVTANERTARADIAFSLVTALIVLS